MSRLSQPTESMRLPSEVAQGDSDVMGGTDQIGAYRSDPSVPHDSADCLIDVREASRQAGCGITKVYRLIKEGRFPVQTYIDGSARWSQREVQQWVVAQLARRAS